MERSGDQRPPAAGPAGVDGIFINSLARARQVAAEGWPLVPLHGKRPLVEGWSELADRPPDPAEVGRWPWDRATGVGLVLGQALAEKTSSWLWVLDIENEHRPAAERWLNGAAPGWIAGLVAETGAWGLHLYFRAARPVRTRTIPWGEVRGERVLVVLPPSIHPETGRPYRWLSTGQPVELDPEVVPGYGGGTGRDGRRPLDVGEVLKGVPLGRRNETLFRLACKLRGADVPEAAALRLLEEAAANCSPPYPSDPGEEPVASIVQRVYTRYYAPDGRVEAPPQRSISPEPLGAPPPGGCTLEWVWEGFLARGLITDLFGLWKAGKTTLIGALLREMAGGGTLAGRRVVAGRALVVTEESAGKWARRCAELAIPPDAHDRIVRPFRRRPSWGEWAAFVDQLAALVRERGYQLVVLDALPNLWPVGDENDAAQVLAAVRPLLGPAEAGAAVLLSRHPRKSDGAEATAGRGSGALDGFVDIIVEFRRYDPGNRLDPRRVLTVYSREEPFEVVAEWAGNTYRALGDRAAVRRDDLRSAVLAAVPESGAVTVEELREAWPTPPAPAPAALRQVLNQLAAEGVLERVGAGRRRDPWRWRRKGGDSISIIPLYMAVTEIETQEAGAPAGYVREVLH